MLAVSVVHRIPRIRSINIHEISLQPTSAGRRIHTKSVCDWWIRMARQRRCCRAPHCSCFVWHEYNTPTLMLLLLLDSRGWTTISPALRWLTFQFWWIRCRKSSRSIRACSGDDSLEKFMLQYETVSWTIRLPNMYIYILFYFLKIENNKIIQFLSCQNRIFSRGHVPLPGPPIDGINLRKQYKN